MKNILKKVAGIAMAITLAFGMFSCSNGSDDPVLPPAPIKETVATPEFSVASGEVDSGTFITITCATEGAKIFFTVDESVPTTLRIEYRSAIWVIDAVTIKAIAVKDGMNDSAVASASYTVNETVATPAFSVVAGEVEKGTEVTISCATESAKIYYTTDGNAPTVSSTEYTTAISVTEAVTIKAIAVKGGMNSSAIASVSYTIKDTVATPEFSVAEGEVEKGTEVTISCATESAKIYYTTDGNEPTASSTEYTTAISVTEAVTIKAIAVKEGMNDSAVASASYTIKRPDYSKCVVGDFILKDGKILSKDSTPQSGTVAAVIVRAAAGGKPALGVGIVHNRRDLAWCNMYADSENTIEVSGYGKIITELQGDERSGYMDGSDGWEKLKAACSDAEKHPEYYPAWKYCLDYATTNGLEGDFANGWYLPTVAELYTIYQNKTAVDASLSKAGGSQFGTSYYWSCSQRPFYISCARALRFKDGSVDYEVKNTYYLSVCSVRAFN